MIMFRTVFRIMDRLLVLRLLRMPFYRGQFDRLLTEDEDRDPHTPYRLSDVARSADLPERPSSRKHQTQPRT
jgi:hypothetical protein